MLCKDFLFGGLTNGCQRKFGFRDLVAFAHKENVSRSRASVHEGTQIAIFCPKVCLL